MGATLIWHDCKTGPPKQSGAYLLWFIEPNGEDWDKTYYNSASHERRISMKSINLRFLMGLPGSGKTMFAKKLSEQSYNKRIIDLDYIFKYSKSQEDKEKKIISAFKQELRFYCAEIILDGLILTKEEVKYFYDLACKVACVTRVIIDFWNPDKEQCIINDSNRGRNQSAKETILKTNFDVLTEQDFVKLFNRKVSISYFLHEVYRVPDYEKFFASQGISMNGKYMESSDWSLGGTSWGWDGSSRTIDPEPQPINFEEFDDLLFEICPNISFLFYKKLYNKTVDIYDYRDNDYYSETVNARYRCDLEKLYELLKKYNLIKENKNENN